MKQKIMCQKGKCFEADILESEFASLFDDSNIVDEIQHSIFKNMMS